MNPWFLTEILTGLQKLFTLSLDRTPAADVIPGTARTWVEALTHGRTWDEQRDTPRIRAAFATLQADSDRWPCPRDLIDALPSSEPQAAIGYDHGIPRSREKRTARLRELLGPEFNPDTADPNYDPQKAHRNADIREAEAALRRITNRESQS
jgi:hypothetical protein